MPDDRTILGGRGNCSRQHNKERASKSGRGRDGSYLPPPGQINEAYAQCCDDEHQDVFWMAYREIGIEDSPLGLICMNSTETGYLSTAQAMNALVDRIRMLINCQEMDEATEQDEMIAGPTQRRAMHE